MDHRQARGQPTILQSNPDWFARYRACRAAIQSARSRADLSGKMRDSVCAGAGGMVATGTSRLLPITERLLDLRHDVLHRDVADNRENGVVRTIVSRVEVGEVFARQLLERICRWCNQRCRMARAVNRRWNCSAARNCGIDR